MSTEIDFKFVFLCYGPLLQMENDFFFIYAWFCGLLYIMDGKRKRSTFGAAVSFPH